MEKYKAMLAEMVTSKKFHTLIAGVATVLSQDPVPGFAMADATVTKIVALIIGYLVAQGWADSGKERAKIEAKAVAKK